jgi:aerobic-type carbon monoxide dehydrogenase small subunit (CoxS/CutS family)
MMETEFRLTVNGTERSVTCEPDTPLLDVLRHDLGLAGPRFGCGMGNRRGPDARAAVRLT